MQRHASAAKICLELEVKLAPHARWLGIGVCAIHPDERAVALAAQSSAAAAAKWLLPAAALCCCVDHAACQRVEPDGGATEGWRALCRPPLLSTTACTIRPFDCPPLAATAATIRC